MEKCKVLHKYLARDLTETGRSKFGSLRTENQVKKKKLRDMIDDEEDCFQQEMTAKTL